MSPPTLPGISPEDLEILELENDRRKWEAALRAGRPPDTPASLRYDIPGYDEIWLLLEADYFHTSRDDLVEAAVQHARYLFQSDCTPPTDGFESDLHEMCTHSAGLFARARGLAAEISGLADSVENEIASLEMRCPRVVVKAPRDFPSPALVAASAAPTPGSQEFIRFLATVHPRSQLFAPDLLAWLIIQAKIYCVTPCRIVQAAIRTARFVMKNCGGSGSTDFRRELLVRQMELDRNALQIDRVLGRMEKVVPVLALNMEVIVRSCDTILRRAENE